MSKSFFVFSLSSLLHETDCQFLLSILSYFGFTPLTVAILPHTVLSMLFNCAKHTVEELLSTIPPMILSVKLAVCESSFSAKFTVTGIVAVVCLNDAVT